MVGEGREDLRVPGPPRLSWRKGGCSPFCWAPAAKLPCGAVRHTCSETRMTFGGKRVEVRRPLGVCSAGQPSPHSPARRPVVSAPGIRTGKGPSTLVPSLPSLCQTEGVWDAGPSWDRGVSPPEWKSGAWTPNFLPFLSLPFSPFLPPSSPLSVSLMPSLCLK